MKVKFIRYHICDKIILSNKINAAMLSEDRLFHTTDTQMLDIEEMHYINCTTLSLLPFSACNFSPVVVLDSGQMERVPCMFALTILYPT